MSERSEVMTDGTRRLRDTMTALADAAPDVRVTSDLYDRSRRRHRRRTAVTTVAATTAGLVAAMAINTPASRPAIAEAGAPGPVSALGGSVGWLVLSVILLACGLVWRHLPWRVRFGRLVALALVGAAIIVTAPPGTAVWGEPRGRAGLPDEVVTPSQWTTARATDSPPGRVAMVFGGRNTRNDFDEGRIAMVAGDGDRYRILDPFTYEEPGIITVLSPDGRYLYHQRGLLDLTTGRAGPEVPDGVRAWSADGRRVVYESGGDGVTYGSDGQEQVEDRVIGVWDLATRQDVLRLTFPGDSVGYARGVALSPDGSRLALQVGQELRLYRVGETQPYRNVPLVGARIGGAAAWTPDGRGLLVARRESCTDCPVPWYNRQWRLEILDAESGAPLPGAPRYPVLPSVVEVAVLGWRTPIQPVVQLYDPAPGARADVAPEEQSVHGYDGPYTARVAVLPDGATSPEPLLRLPEGTEDVTIAADYLKLPIRSAGPATYGPPHGRVWFVLFVPWTITTVAMVMIGLWPRIRRKTDWSRPTDSGDAAERVAPPTPARSASAQPAPAQLARVETRPTGRWRRSGAAVGVALVAWLLASIGVGVKLASDPAPGQTAATGTIPQTVVRPYSWMGAGGDWTHASVIYGGGDPSTLYAVDAGSDAQRVFAQLGPVERGSALLSPDGGTIVYSGPDQTIRRIVLGVDSEQGEPLPGADLPAGPHRPLAWQPKQQGIVVGVRGADQRWSLWRTNAYLAHWSKAADLGADAPLTGRTAYAPDGAAVAVQSGEQVRVITADNQVRGPWSLPANARLAGPGAWTPDGLIIAEPEAGSPEAATDANVRRWRFRLVDPDTGADRGPLALPSVTGFAVKLLGHRDGTTYLARYEAVSGTRVDGRTDELALNLSHVEVLAVAPGDAPPRRLVGLPDGVGMVDIAADALAYAEPRPGGGRPYEPLPGWVWWPAFPLVVAGLSAGLWWLSAVLRLRLRRRRIEPSR